MEWGQIISRGIVYYYVQGNSILESVIIYFNSLGNRREGHIFLTEHPETSKNLVNILVLHITKCYQLCELDNVA